MKERLQFLKAYANANDNWWLKNELEHLETEIKIAVMDGKTEVYKDMEKLTDELFKK